MADNKDYSNGWDRYQLKVMGKLEDHDILLTDISKLLVKIQVDIGQLKIKAGIWGAIAGMIPTLAALLIYFLTNL